MKRTHALPQNLHLMDKRSRTWRLCGSLTGGFARVSEKKWLKKFFEGGGGLCPECRKLAPPDVMALMQKKEGKVRLEKEGKRKMIHKEKSQ